MNWVVSLAVSNRTGATSTEQITNCERGQQLAVATQRNPAKITKTATSSMILSSKGSVARNIKCGMVQKSKLQAHQATVLIGDIDRPMLWQEKSRRSHMQVGSKLRSYTGEMQMVDFPS